MRDFAISPHSRKIGEISRFRRIREKSAKFRDFAISPHSRKIGEISRFRDFIYFREFAKNRRNFAISRFYLFPPIREKSAKFRDFAILSITANSRKIGEISRFRDLIDSFPRFRDFAAFAKKPRLFAISRFYRTLSAIEVVFKKRLLHLQREKKEKERERERERYVQRRK